jgi:hypothetical protein
MTLQTNQSPFLRWGGDSHLRQGHSSLVHYCLVCGRAREVRDDWAVCGGAIKTKVESEACSVDVFALEGGGWVPRLEGEGADWVLCGDLRRENGADDGGGGGETHLVVVASWELGKMRREKMQRMALDEDLYILFKQGPQ